VESPNDLKLITADDVKDEFKLSLKNRKKLWAFLEKQAALQGPSRSVRAKRHGFKTAVANSYHLLCS